MIEGKSGRTTTLFCFSHRYFFFNLKRKRYDIMQEAHEMYRHEADQKGQKSGFKMVPQAKKSAKFLHIGTNDLSSYSDKQVTGYIMKLIAEIEKHNIKCSVSSIII